MEFEDKISKDTATHAIVMITLPSCPYPRLNTMPCDVQNAPLVERMIIKPPVIAKHANIHSYSVLQPICPSGLFLT